MRKVNLVLAAAIMTVTMSITSYAGAWTQSEIGWQYQNDDGSYSTNRWQWIDGNNDGISENYYFNESGYCLMNTSTPDGNLVDLNGAWIINGVVQTQAAPPVQFQETQAGVPTQATGISSSPYDGYTIVVNTNTKKYHTPGCSSVSKMAAKNTGYCSDAAYLDGQGYSACKICH